MLDKKIQKYILHIFLFFVIITILYYNFGSVEGFQAGFPPIPLVGTPAQQAWTVPYINDLNRPLPSWATPSQIQKNTELRIRQPRIYDIINANITNPQVIQALITFIEQSTRDLNSTTTSDSQLLDLIQSVADRNSAVLLSTLTNLETTGVIPVTPIPVQMGIPGALSTPDTPQAPVFTPGDTPPPPTPASNAPTPAPNAPTPAPNAPTPAPNAPTPAPSTPPPASTGEAGILLLQSIVGSSPPSEVTPAQIKTLKKYWANHNYIYPTKFGIHPSVANAINTAYLPGNSVTQNADAITVALRNYITSGQLANNVNPPAPVITDPTILALINDPSLISTANLPAWIVPGTRQSWMTSEQQEQFNTLQIKASTIPSMPNASDVLGTLLAIMRSRYVYQKAIMKNRNQDSDIFMFIKESVEQFLNSRAYGQIPDAPTNTPAPNSWPSFTGATLPIRFLNLKTAINNISEIGIDEKLSRISSGIDYLSANESEESISYAMDEATRPIIQRLKNVSATSWVPVGFKGVCKLSDIYSFVTTTSLPSNIFDPAITIAQYRDIISKAPEGTIIQVIDTATGTAVWDPINYFNTNNTIQKLPNTTNVGTYIFYTNLGKFYINELPSQTQSEKDIIDRILYNMLDIFVGINNMDKSSGFYNTIMANFGADPKLLKLLPLINKFQFQNIVYEQYSTVVEDFQNSGTVDIYKLYNHDKTPIFTDNTSIYMGIAGIAGVVIIGASGYMLYRYMRKNKTII
jgi:hypothetical protein